MKIKLCAFADEYSDYLDKQIEGLKEFNIPYVELRGVNLKNVSVCTIEDAKAWKKELDKNGIKVWAIGSPVGKVSISEPIEKHLEVVKNICEIARVLDCDKIRGFSFYDTKGVSKKEVISKLKQIVDLAKSYNITIYHENEKDVFGENIENCEYLLDNIKELKCVYDPANFVQCGVNVKDALNKLQNRVDYYHVKDAYYSDSAVVPAGKGDGMLEEMIKGITKDTVLTLEPHLAIFSGYSQIDKTELKTHYQYSSHRDAFIDAVNHLKDILIKNGYKEEGDVWIK